MGHWQARAMATAPRKRSDILTPRFLTPKMRSLTVEKDTDGIGYALRFPRAQGFIRDDKNAEDATTVAEIVTMSENQKVVKLR